MGEICGCGVPFMGPFGVGESVFRGPGVWLVCDSVLPVLLCAVCDSPFPVRPPFRREGLSSVPPVGP
jgi:hypothetical protein